MTTVIIFWPFAFMFISQSLWCSSKQGAAASLFGGMQCWEMGSDMLISQHALLILQVKNVIMAENTMIGAHFWALHCQMTHHSAAKIELFLLHEKDPHCCLTSVNKINQVQNQVKFQNVLTLQAYNSNGPHKDWGSRAAMQSHTHSNPSPTSAPSTVTVKVNARKGIMHKIWTKSYILMDVLSVAWLEIHWGVTVCFSSISLPCSCKCRMIEACVVVK